MSRRIALRVAAGVVAAVVVLAGVPSVLLATSLIRARGSLTAAAAALRSGDVATARSHLSAVRTAASSAHTMTDAPVLRGVAAATGLGRDLSAAGVLAKTAVDGATAGLMVVDAVPGGAGRGVEALYREGVVDFEAVAALRDATRRAGGLLARSERGLEGASTPRLGSLRRQIDRARTLVERGRSASQRASTLLGLLPGFAGQDSERRYFLAFQSPSEARGGGGLIGVYGILTARDGRLDLDRVAPVEDLVARLDGRVQAPGWFVSLYGGFLGTRDPREANPSPHFPTTAEVLLRMYERATGEVLDGVIALDPFAVGELTRGSGPLRAPGWDKTITRNNVRRVLLHDIYREFDFKERMQNDYLRGLVDVLWSRLEAGDLRVAPALRGLADAVAKQRLKVYSRVPREQDAWSVLGAAGDYRRAGPSLQMMFHNNHAANKVDYFLRREVDTRITLRDDGSADVRVVATLDNVAPSERGTVLVRPLRRDLPPGINRMTLYFLLPRGARATAMRVDERDHNVLRGREGRYPVAWQVLDVPAGSSATVELTYRWPEVLTASGEVRFSLWPQALVRTDAYRVTLEAPPGHAVAGRAGARRAPSWSGRLRAPVTIRAHVVPADQAQK